MSLSTKVLFFCFSSLLLLPCQKTLVFRFFSINSQVILKNSRPLASNFSILLSNLLKKISIQEFYDTETTTARRKQKNKTLVDRKQLLGSIYVCIDFYSLLSRFRFWTDRYKKVYTTKNMVKSVKSTTTISRNNLELVA